MNPRPLTAVLRQVSPEPVSHTDFYPLSIESGITLGRDPNCEITLNSKEFKGVSRQHARIDPVVDNAGEWCIYDLDSSNGTYVNGERVNSYFVLSEGDRIGLGRKGPQFVIELLDSDFIQQSLAVQLPITADGHPGHPPGSVAPGLSQSFDSDLPADVDVTLSQLFPILSTGGELTQKAYLVPGVITVLFVVLMFVYVGNSAMFNTLLAAYLSAAAYYFVYQLCGKHKPWWLLAGSGLLTAIILMSPVLSGFIFVFREVLPGNIPQEPDSTGVINLLSKMFFGAGLMEELIKALPVLMAWIVGRYARSSRYRRMVGVNEPLDGILIGTASAIGFTLIETLKIYIPNVVDGVILQSTGIDNELMGLQLLIPRILGSVFGHMAYSGYLGYFIGLSAIKPQKRWRILIVGYLSASILHALWNTTGFVNPVVLALIGMVSYACLAAAILKARALSPNRADNFATRVRRVR